MGVLVFLRFGERTGLSPAALIVSLFSFESNPESRVNAAPESESPIRVVNVMTCVSASGKITVSWVLTGRTETGPMTNP